MMRQFPFILHDICFFIGATLVILVKQDLTSAFSTIVLRGELKLPQKVNKKKIFILDCEVMKNEEKRTSLVLLPDS